MQVNTWPGGSHHARIPLLGRKKEIVVGTVTNVVTVRMK